MAALHQDRLIKLLNLTTSDNDHEALLALRNAQAMMKSAGVSWEDLLARSGTGRTKAGMGSTPAQSPRTTTQSSKRVVVETPIPPRGKTALASFRWIHKLFLFLFEKSLFPKQTELRDGIHRYWVDRGTLTPKQQETIERMCAQYGFG